MSSRASAHRSDPGARKLRRMLTTASRIHDGLESNRDVHDLSSNSYEKLYMCRLRAAANYGIRGGRLASDWCGENRSPNRRYFLVDPEALSQLFSPGFDRTKAKGSILAQAFGLTGAASPVVSTAVKPWMTLQASSHPRRKETSRTIPNAFRSRYLTAPWH